MDRYGHQIAIESLVNKHCNDVQHLIFQLRSRKMPISFDENEQILFKSKATYNSKLGEIVVTSLRFAWVSGAPSIQEFQTAWANIQNIKYSPADDPKERVMAMIQMVAGSSSEKPPVFHLTGPTKDGCRMELERLKSVVAAVRKGKLPEGSDPKDASKSINAPETSTLREKKRSRTQMTIDKNSVDYTYSVALTEKRKNLLGNCIPNYSKHLISSSKLLKLLSFTSVRAVFILTFTSISILHQK